jgi:hypothetical protein
MRSIFKYCTSILLVLIFLHAVAQEKKDSVEITLPDSLRGRNIYLPTGIRIGTDVFTAIKSYRNLTFDGWEVNADIDFNRYYLAVDYGRWSQGVNLPNGWYNNDGKYIRFGVDMNMLKRDPDRNMFFLGLRYAHASFSDSAAYSFADKYYGNIQKYLVNPNLTANWMEITTGLRAKIWKFFWMGYTIRLKFAPRVHGSGELQTYDIPGYGVSARTAYWGFNYQLFFRIPLRKQPRVIDAKEE